MKNSITANTEIGGTFINVEVTPIENGKRIDGYTVLAVGAVRIINN